MTFLPALSEMGRFSMVVTSAVLPIPKHWMEISRLRVTVSVDGLPEHHDVRRNPATYERILKNIAGRRINVHWVITKPMLERSGYLEEYAAFWDARPEVDHIWVSLYSPQMGEQSEEILSAEDRLLLVRELPRLRRHYPKLLVNQGIGHAFISPPENPQECLFAKMSVNYSADLETRVEPCVFGGNPDCTQCGCAMSSALHWMKTIKVAGPVRIDHLVTASMRVGSAVSRLASRASRPGRWSSRPQPAKAKTPLVQISTSPAE